MGGVDPAITKAQRVVIHAKDGPVKGVVGNVAPHLTKGDPDRKVPKMEDLFIDIGVSSRKEAEKLVRIGDPITLNDQFELLRNDLAIARAFDNRVGTFAVAEALRQLSGGQGQAARPRFWRCPTSWRKSACWARGRSPTRSSRMSRWSSM